MSFLHRDQDCVAKAWLRYRGADPGPRLDTCMCGCRTNWVRFLGLDVCVSRRGKGEGIIRTYTAWSSRISRTFGGGESIKRINRIEKQGSGCERQKEEDGANDNGR